MSIFEDGSYSSESGISLIAKVLAGRCQMKYTKAAVGKGTIPDGKSPKTMQEPAGYVMNAKISDVTNPVNGECQVTVQINSSDVEKGFYATGILLYAEDPDEGEVPYTYLVLENEPEWIRPSSSVVGKLATFELIAAVGEVDKVTACIDPDSIVTKEVLEQFVTEKLQNYHVIRITGAYDSGRYYVGFASLPLPKSQGRAEVTLLVSGIGNAEKPSCGTYLVQCSTRNEICMTVTELTPSGISESNPGTAFGYWMKDDRVCFGMRREAFSYCTNITVVSEDVDEEGISKYEVAEIYNSWVTPADWTNVGIRKFLEEKEDAESASSCVTLWRGIICDESGASVSFYVPKKYWHNDNLTLMIDCVKYQSAEYVSPSHSKTVMATVTRKRDIYVVVDKVVVLDTYSAFYPDAQGGNMCEIYEKFATSDSNYTIRLHVNAVTLTTTDYAEVTVIKSDSSKYVITDIYAVMPQEQEG